MSFVPSVSMMLTYYLLFIQLANLVMRSRIEVASSYKKVLNNHKAKKWSFYTGLTVILILMSIQGYLMLDCAMSGLKNLDPF